ncbi:MAG TPA: DUF6797 domain-containing protein [Candidatus Limnocylindria bacterium]|nr:DUF6797 domain-containing protein [Candidatus Limnocylindria bacterium]
MATALGATIVVQAADPEPVRGPFWSGTIMRGKDNPAAMKGLAVTLGPEKKSYVVYDLDTLRLSVAWTGQFLEFGNTLTKIEWPPPPSVKGTPMFSTANGPGWADRKGNLTDPRAKHQGPLPKDWAHYEGVYVNGDRVVLKYTVGGATVLESPEYRVVDGQNAFIRNFEFTDSARDVVLNVLSAEGLEVVASAEGTVLKEKDQPQATLISVDGVRNVTWDFTDGQLRLKLPKVASNKPFRVIVTSHEIKEKVTPKDFPKFTDKPADLRLLTKGGPAHWPETVTTQGKLGTEDGPYVVDSITEPFPNPYNTRTFWGGFDFLPDGRAVICAFHGDVWIVSGIDDKLDKLVWKRFASGLFQPLGVKVRNGEIYVAGRDQITHLKDLNGDGEADLYENFNNDTVVTPNYHEFVLDLHTDAEGNFYYAKGAPWEPSVSSPHQGCLIKVSRDGRKLEVVATGLRAPNGMTVGPDGTILVSDNQGHWMPSSKLNLVKPGGFYGMVPSAQRELTLRYPDGREIKVNPSDPDARKQNGLKGWDKEMPIPTSYDQPVAWLPMRWDNSSGGQTFVTSDRWGPWKGAPLFASYGKCLLYAVLMDKVDGTSQASMVPFGLKFQSGVMRARFSDRDGQLYLCGLKGWQNSATRDGGFYRVRYTGKPVKMATAAHVAQNGIQLKFSTELDAKAAADPASYSVELWNYRYSGAYGSPELTVKTPGKDGHDKLEVKNATLSADHKQLFLAIDGLQVADQYSVKYRFSDAEPASEIIGTIHKLGAPMATESVK